MRNPSAPLRRYVVQYGAHNTYHALYATSPTEAATEVYNGTGETIHAVYLSVPFTLDFLTQRDTRIG